MRYIFSIILFMLVFSLNLFSQELIDVQSMTISQSHSTGRTAMGIVARNSTNQQVSWGYYDSSALTGYSAFTCGPCGFSVLSTNGFGEFGLRANLGQNEGQIIVTFSSPPTSDDIYLRPIMLPRKKQEFQCNGATRLLVSSIKVTDRFSNVIAIDNDVTFDGSFVANFNQYSPNFPGRRLFGFQNITFNFDEPRN